MISRRGDMLSADDQAEPRGFDAYDLRLGDIMRGERATMGKSLLDVQRELKIKATYIAAIENADPSAFETPGFIAGYVRSYARYLGLDPEWAYQTFCREGNFAVSHGMSPAASGSKPRSAKVPVGGDPFNDPNSVFASKGDAMFSRIEPGALGSVAVLLMLIVGLGFGGWSVLQEIQRVEFAPIDQAPGVVADLDAQGGTETRAPVDTEVAALATAPAPDALDRLYRPQALDVPVLVARDGPIAAIDPATNGALAGLAPSDLPSGPVFAVPSPLDPIDAPVQVVEADVPDVAIFAVRPSWVRVSAADGSVLFEKILDAGERYVLPATQEPPVLRSGNAGAVYFAVNGQAYGPAGSESGVVKNVALTVDGIKGSFVLADLSKDSALADYVRVARAEGVMVEDTPASE